LKKKSEGKRTLRGPGVDERIILKWGFGLDVYNVLVKKFEGKRRT